jgi:hypothetical protein
MAHGDNGYESAPPNVLLMLAMAVGMWGLIYLGIASVWSREPDRPGVSIEREYVPQVATLDEQLPRLRSSSPASMRAMHNKRSSQTFAQRILRASPSGN